MERRLEVSDAAREDLFQAASWYNTHGSSLADRFLGSFEECLADIALVPKGFTEVRPNVRRALLHRFPYAVYYRVSPEVVTIVAVLHCSRSPRLLRRRL